MARRTSEELLDFSDLRVNQIIICVKQDKVFRATVTELTDELITCKVKTSMGCCPMTFRRKDGINTQGLKFGRLLKRHFYSNLHFHRGRLAELIGTFDNTKSTEFSARKSRFQDFSKAEVGQEIVKIVNGVVQRAIVVDVDSRKIRCVIITAKNKHAIEYFRRSNGIKVDSEKSRLLIHPYEEKLIVHQNTLLRVII